jgi:hypothetical protein
MRWAVLVALLLVGMGSYSLLDSAHDLGMSVMADATRSSGSAAPRLLGRDVRVAGGMALVELACENPGGCRGVMTIGLAGGQTGSAPYALLGGQTSRHVLPLPAGARAEHATVSWIEDAGATASAEVRLRRG